MKERHKKRQVQAERDRQADGRTKIEKDRLGNDSYNSLQTHSQRQTQSDKQKNSQPKTGRNRERG